MMHAANCKRGLIHRHPRTWNDDDNPRWACISDVGLAGFACERDAATLTTAAGYMYASERKDEKKKRKKKKNREYKNPGLYDARVRKRPGAYVLYLYSQTRLDTRLWGSKPSCAVYTGYMFTRSPTKVDMQL